MDFQFEIKTWLFVLQNNKYTTYKENLNQLNATTGDKDVMLDIVQTVHPKIVCH